MLGRQHLSGRQLERIIGHCTYSGLVNRNVINIFSAVYEFIGCHFLQAGRMWISVKTEMWAFPSVMLKLPSKLSGGWSHMVLATDACPSGYGVTCAKLETAVVSCFRRFRERSRFRKAELTQARQRALASRCISDMLEEGEIELDPDFPWGPFE